MVIQEKNIDSAGIKDSAFSDTASHKNVIKAAKIIPIQKIESEDGAIIPRQAMEMIELQPALPMHPKPSFFEKYGVYIVGLLFLFIIVYLLRRKKKSKKG
ncbi:hypothetical protein MQE36_16945 [Zhouia spongiae]|uniref:LPXTG cell wall anchor domain-containing protein n=1 Tax=Zhouia spongiae TaxID=2202721 RepID=A0ABY3YMM6_9FLAO|nr:hypothetical protein [Zhouia spongiae]UNY98751.1 hypothetical protein MQE36_16945 [Zhouia spongiae]